MKALKATLMGVGAAALMLSCAGGQQASQLTVSGLDPAKFDTTIQSKPVKLYTLKNQNGMEVCITNYGGRIVSLVVPDKDGKPTEYWDLTTSPSMPTPSTLQVITVQA